MSKRHKPHRKFYLPSAVNIRSRIARIQSEMQYVQPDTVAWDTLDIEQHMLEHLLQDGHTHVPQEFLQGFQRMLRNPIQRSHYLAQVMIGLMEVEEWRESTGQLAGDTTGIYTRGMEAVRTLVYEQQERAHIEAGILLH